MADDAEGKLKSLFTKLQELIDNKQGGSKRAVRVIDDILKAAPDDADALKCKAVALVWQEKFGEALVFLQSQPALAQSLAYERAYCYYRLGRFDEALAAVREVAPEREVGRLQLEAQVQYRRGNKQDAIQLYSQLFQQHKVETIELRTCVIAAYVSGGRSREVGAVMEAMQISAADSYELGFNRACALLDLGDYAAAEEQLQLALRAGREDLFEEEMGEAAVEEELAPLTLQLALVHSRLGRRAEAAAAYEALEKLDLDAATAAVLLNNAAAQRLAGAALASRPKARLTEALRRLDGLVNRASGTAQRLAPALESRLSGAQREALLYNRALLMAAAHRTEAARAAVAAFERQFPASPRTPLLRAALMLHEGKGAEADALLVGASAEVAVLAALMRVQLALLAGDSAAAVQLLGSLPNADLRHRPAVIATLASLQEQSGDAGAAEGTLRAALEWWGASMTAEPAAAASAQQWILGRLTGLAIAGGRVQEASQHFETLRALGGVAGGEDVEVLAALAAAFGRSREQGAEALEGRLPAAAALSAKEVDALENAVVSGTARRMRKVDSAIGGPGGSSLEAAAAAAGPSKLQALKRGAAAGADGTAAAKKRRKRKPQYPKGFDPANPGPPPDPERWLAKWQRSDFKKKKERSSARRKDKEQVKGSQGAGRVDESLDISSKAASEGPKLPPGKGPPRGAGGARKKGRR